MFLVWAELYQSIYYILFYLGANTEDGLMNQSSISSAYREGGTNSGVGGALLRNAGAIGKSFNFL